MAPSASHPVVLVTGASKGLGLCIASLLVKGTKTIPPSNVVTLSRSVPPALSALESETKAQATSLLVVQGDMTSQEDNARTVDAAIAKWGRLDGVVLNAGVIEFARIADVDPSSFARQLNINVTSLIITLQAALPHLRASPTGCGKAVFVSSGAAASGRASWGAYNASKAAMGGVARTLATEEPNVASWAVQPGVVDTDMQRDIREKGKAHMGEEEHSKFTQLHSTGKLLPAEQPGHVLAALAVMGTRSKPANWGSQGAFVKWDAEELKEFRQT